MTNEQRERIAREVLGWTRLRSEGAWHMPECLERGGCNSLEDLPAEDDPRWLFPAMEALMLRRWFPAYDLKWFSMMMLTGGFRIERDTLPEAINAALLIEVGE